MNEKIVNCDFVFKCPQAWDKMAETENEGIRFCGECQKNVYFADSPEVLNQLSREGKCVAVVEKAPVYDLRDEPAELKGFSSKEPDYYSKMTAGMPARPENFTKQAVIGENSETSPYWILWLIGLIIGVIFIVGLFGFFILWLIFR